MADWQELSTPEGRTYYFNRVTKKTQWEKPPELAQVWKEYSTPDGRKYYFNTLTNATQWERPPEIDQAWRACSTADGKHYYYNEITKKAQWEKPTEFITDHTVVPDETKSVETEEKPGANLFADDGSFLEMFKKSNGAVQTLIPNKRKAESPKAQEPSTKSRKVETETKVETVPMVAVLQDKLETVVGQIKERTSKAVRDKEKKEKKEENSLRSKYLQQLREAQAAIGENGEGSKWLVR